MIMKNRLPDEASAGGVPSEYRSSPGGIPGEALKYLGTIEDYVVEHPGPCLAAAFAVGVVVAWWIKRT